MKRYYSGNPQLQPIKGVFVFTAKEKNYVEQALELLKTLDCEVVATSDNRMTVTTSRGNLQKIKECWLAKDKGNERSMTLNRQVSQIIIGGRT